MIDTDKQRSLLVQIFLLILYFKLLYITLK